MSDAKAKWQKDINSATRPNSAVAQLLNARIFDLEATVIDQATRIALLEQAHQDIDYDALAQRLQPMLQSFRKSIREELRLLRTSGCL